MLASMAHLSGVIKYKDLDMERLSCTYAGGHNVITSILKAENLSQLQSDREKWDKRRNRKKTKA